MKNIVIKQRAERDDLASRPYYTRKHLQDVAPYLEADVIKLITGPRRAGKSVYALQILSGKNYAYLNFDDTQLLGSFDEDAVMQALAEVYPGYEYLLLDEVQNLDSWDAWVSKLYRRGVNLVITGSNANLLSSEMSTLLTGRYVEIQILPFSMEESLKYREAPIDAELPEEKAKLFIEMDDYLKKGGYPEIVKNREIEQAYLTALFDSIILKDVAQRHKIRKITELYDLADYLISNYSNPLSYNEIAEELSLGSVTTVKKFCGYLAEPYLFFYLPRYNNKLKEMKKAPRKVYVVDNGFIYTRSFELSSNNGRQLENMVFIELLRRGYDLKKSLFYYRTSNDKEVDFVTRDGRKVTSLIQVSYDISKAKTRERELDALVKASEELKCDNLLIITWAVNDRIEYREKSIRIVSAQHLNLCSFV
jgi:predicted AAA+ superfamily ATPase